ncbi:hypothetical protein BHM03_00054313 [Ensete ventricosum]|nr:hypothetical protein BHM03_00054313 [Ensete ventricosum]
MDLETLLAPEDAAYTRLCPCACPFCCRSPSPSWRRSMKRRLDPEASADCAGPSPAGGDVAARVEVEDEVAALREAVASQQQSIQELLSELEEERNAAASAASEAMSMILRLQREKAETQMEARQFKRFAEERMDHDQQEILALEDLLFKREEAVQFLTFRLQAYARRLLSYGIDPNAVDADPAPASTSGAKDDAWTPQLDEFPTFDYPPLKCALPYDVEHEENHYDEAPDREKYASGETPQAKEDLEDLEQRICQLEAYPDDISLMEKGVIEELPRPLSDSRHSFADSHGSVSTKNLPELTKREEFPASMDKPLDDGSGFDDMADRVYTIDAVHGVPTVMVSEDCVDTPMKEEMNGETDGRLEGGSPDIKNLYMRLQALEADRESMRQTIISMQTEKAQLVLLREIAQQLYKEVAPESKIVQKKSSTANFSIVGLLKGRNLLQWGRKKMSILSGFLYPPPPSAFLTAMTAISGVVLAYFGLSEAWGKHLQYSKFWNAGSPPSDKQLRISSRVGMLLLYTPALVAAAAAFAFPAVVADDRCRLLALALALHFFKRDFEV